MGARSIGIFGPPPIFHGFRSATNAGTCERSETHRHPTWRRQAARSCDRGASSACTQAETERQAQAVVVHSSSEQGGGSLSPFGGQRPGGLAAARTSHDGRSIDKTIDRTVNVVNPDARATGSNSDFVRTMKTTKRGPAGLGGGGGGSPSRQRRMNDRPIHFGTSKPSRSKCERRPDRTVRRGAVEPWRHTSIGS
jgi:hypothetical protein